MIAPGYPLPPADRPGSTQKPAPLPSISLHLHFPDRLTEAVVQFLATLSTSPVFESSFSGLPRNPLSRQREFPLDQLEDPTPETASQYSMPPTNSPTQPHGGLAPDPETDRRTPAVSPPAADSGSPGHGTGTTPTGSETTYPESLLALYQQAVLPSKQNYAGKKAIAEHVSSCRLFDLWNGQFWSKDLRPAWPKVLFQAPDLLRNYARWMLLENGNAVDTAAKRMKHVAMIVKAALQIELEKPTKTELKRILDTRENGKPSTSALAERRIPATAEVDALATLGVLGAKWPYGDHAPYFWRGLIRMASLYGFRTYDIVSLIPQKTGLCKQDIHWESLCPLPDVSNALGRELHSPHGWLHYSIEKDTHSDCRRILLPMPKWLRDWLRFFFEFSDHPQRVFPGMRGQALSAKWWTREWRRIIADAQVDPRIVISEGTGGKIAIRKYAANWWHLTTLQQRQDLSLADRMSFYVLHHGEVTVAARNYLSTQASVLPVMLELLERFPLPARDAAPVSLLPE